MKTRRRPLILAALALLLLLAALVPRDFFNKPKELHVDDLAVTKGQIVSYTLLDDSREMHQYVIRLSEYQATFQIPGDFAQYFAKTRFESDLKTGDPVSLSIPVANAAKLITTGTIPVFAVRAGAETYLDEHSTLEAYNNKNKIKQVPAWTMWGPFIAAASTIVLIGLACVIWKIARAISARPRKPETLSDPQALQESSQRLKKVLTKGAPEQKSLTMPEQKRLTNGDSEQEVIVTGDPEQKPGDAPPH